MTQFRAKALLFTIVFVLGAIALGFAIDDLATLKAGLDQHRSIIVSEHYAVSGLILGIMAFAIAVGCVIPSPAATPAISRHKQPPVTNAWTKRLLIVIAACIFGAGVAPMVQYHLVDAAAVRRGYARCQAITWPRRQPDRWAMERSHCPKEGTSADG